MCVPKNTYQVSVMRIHVYSVPYLFYVTVGVDMLSNC